MIQDILFFTRYTLILFFGIVLSVAFLGLHFSKKTILTELLLFAVCGLLQLFVFVQFGESSTWKLYPLITHLPIGIVLCFVFRKRISTVLAAISSAYLCCQPSKWFGLLFEALTESYVAEQIVCIVVLLIVGFISIRYLTSHVSEIYNKDTRSIYIFSGMPLIYYVFDYVTGIYTDFWISNTRMVTEFLPFLLCITFFVFCIVYYKEYEKKTDAERKEQIIRITAQQQEKEISAIKKSDMETRLLRHDMRLLLESLALSIEQNDKENSLKMISGYVSQIEATSLHRYCENNIINYILTNFDSKCRDLEISFHVTVEMGELTTDEIMFSSIVSNALDNALNAQKDLPVAERQIHMMLKTSDEKLLLSVKNPFQNKPVFVDGLPLSNRKGHGYGTQSIRYMTERLGGKCQFILQNNMFVLRVIL